jgi:hypothetical protein
MSILETPNEMPPSNLVNFIWTLNLDSKVKESYQILMNGVLIGMMYQMADDIWRIDTVRDSKAITGLGGTADICKIYWWRNWKSYDPPTCTSVE